MNIRKLLDWRKLLIYSHRWLGIGIIVMFLVWTLSGVVLMYYGHPQITTGERLLRLAPIDFSTATVTPAQAAAKAGIKPTRVRLSMYAGRPVYRLTRNSIGNWSTVYADTGEVLPRMGREQALKWMKQFAPEYASTMTYDAYLESPDEFTRIPTLAGFLPLHRIAMNDPAGHEYYISEKSNDIVQQTDRRGRILAISGYVLHNLFFFRQRTWWTPLLDFIAWTAMLMAMTGIVLGIWRVALKPRFRHKGVLSLHALFQLDEVAPLCRPRLWPVFDLLDPERNDPDHHVPDPGVVAGGEARRKQRRRFHHGDSNRFSRIHDDEGHGARHNRRAIEPATAPDGKPAEGNRADRGTVRSEGSGTHTVQRRALLPGLSAARYERRGRTLDHEQRDQHGQSPAG